MNVGQSKKQWHYDADLSSLIAIAKSSPYCGQIASTAFEVELFKGKRCLETIKTETGNTATLSSIEVGNYKLRLSDTKGEITSLAIRMEQ